MTRSLLDKDAEKEILPLQYGDVEVTFADVDDFGYKPTTSLLDGMTIFKNWFRSYYV